MKCINHKSFESTQSSDHTIGVGEVELEENEKSQTVLLDVEILERTIHILKEMKLEFVMMRVESNNPLLFTSRQEDKTKPPILRGILVSPWEWE